MKRFVVLSSLFAIVLAACQPAEKEPIKIGFIGPLTGDAASYGVDTFNGAKLKVDELNAAGGIHGQMIELIAEDARCNGSDASSATQKLVHVDKVVGIIGGSCSSETLAAAPIAEAAQVIIISPLASSPDVTDAGDFIFRDYPSDALKSEAMVQYLNDQDLEKVAAVSENTDFAIGFRDALKENLPEGGLVFDEVQEPGEKDYRTTLTRLQDVEFDIFFPNAQSPAVGAVMMQQFRELGFEQPAISHDVFDTTSFIDVAGEAAEGVNVINVPSLGSDTEFGSMFVSKFGEAQGGIAYAGHAYDALGVLAQAIESVGTEGAAIRDYLYALDGYDGVVGTFRFDSNGDVIGIPYMLKEVIDGEFNEITPIQVN